MANSIQEAHGATIELHDDDPDHFKTVLEFVYTQKFQMLDDSTTPSDNDITKGILDAMGVYAVADKYDIANITAQISEAVRASLAVTRAEGMLATIITEHYRTRSNRR